MELGEDIMHSQDARAYIATGLGRRAPDGAAFLVYEGHLPAIIVGMSELERLGVLL
jgi:hypothetical protein